MKTIFSLSDPELSVVNQFYVALGFKFSILFASQFS